MEHIYIPQQDYKVLVRTITYNQAQYIADTLDGVAIQQTNFPFVHYVIDDCSTDGEQEVIKDWLKEHCDMDKAEYIEIELARVILVPHRTNENLTLAIYLLKRNLWKEGELKESLVLPWREHADYEAFCEGDDYWIDSNKLQKQYDILENHLDCNLALHKVQTTRNEVSISTLPIQNLKTGTIAPENVFKKFSIIQFQLSSFFIRTQPMLDFYKNAHPFCKPIDVGDLQLLLYFFGMTNVYYTNKIMSTYRMSVSNGWSDSVAKSTEKRIKHYQNLSELFKNYDDFTKGRFHSYCVYKQRKCEYLTEKNKGKYKNLFSWKYKDCLLSEFKQIPYLFYKAYIHF